MQFLPPQKMKNCRLVLGLSLLRFCVIGNAAETPLPAAESAPVSAYPRIDLAPQYKVVAGWPAKPANIEWGGMPSIAVDGDDNVWIFTRKNPMVQIYASDGRYLGGWREENPKAVPHALKFDREGNVWLVDAGLHVVRKYSRDGRLLQVIGTLGELGEDATHFNSPTDIAFAPNGDILVSDGYGNNRIARFDATGRFIKAWGKLGVTPGLFSIPHALAFDSKGRLYVADRNNVRIQIFDVDGQLLDVWSNIIVPWGFWISPQDEIWVCGSTPMPWRTDPRYPTAPLGCPPQDQLFAKFDPAGRMLQLTMIPKGVDGQEKPGELNWFHTMAIDSKGDIYAGDIIGKRAQKFIRR